ncbi:MAG: SGNH/GDSL hydrolase family protein [Butyrivibrio sp.]|nr:SGNH/GDSL hydrolase family protein [Acetatifactor muris]MCM1558458.1 SGNH/GDSL hydrolase family protein [Butyrivibrio sp.]
MNLSSRKQKPEAGPYRYICGAVAALLSLSLFLFILKTVQGHSGEQTVEIVVFGDSVFGEGRGGTAVPAQLETLSGRSVYNAAFGGTCAARLEQGKPLDYTRGTFSLVSLVKSVEADDFGVQQSVIMRESNAEYFEEVIDGLEKLDFSKVDIYIIQQGLNDYQQAVPIENPEDIYDEHTFLGALRVAVHSLKSRTPEARIVFVTPLFTWYTAAGWTCETDYGGGTLEDYVNAEISLAGELGVEVIDVYHDFFPHEEWEDWKLYSRDGMHPNEAGREKMARRIAEYLEQK